MTSIIVVSVLCNCCYCFLLVARHVTLNVVKCDSKSWLSRWIFISVFLLFVIKYVQCLMKKLFTLFEMSIHVNADKLQVNVWGLFQCRKQMQEIYSFIWVSAVRVEVKHLARLFNSACWWAVNQAWAFDNMPDCTASHASVCPHKAAHDVTQNWSILINHWPFRGCTGTTVNWLSK